MTIRKAIPEDALGIHNAHMESIQTICSKDHSIEEVKAWGYRPFKPEQRIDSIKNDHVWVVDCDGKIEGYGHLKIFEKGGLKKGHIFGLYFTNKILNKGFGRKVFDLMLAQLKNENAQMVTLESTLTAHAFYQKLGFRDEGGESKIFIGETPIRCFKMRMDLSNSSLS